MKAITKPHSIFLDLFLSIITLGLFNFWIQIRQIVDTNEVMGRDQFSIFKVIVFSILTLGLYFAYHEFKMTRELHKIRDGVENPTIEFISMVLAFLGFWFIVDSYQQSLLNDISEKNTDESLSFT